MENQDVYENFITWMKRTWIGLPDSEALLPAIKSRYSGEEAALLTGMSFSPKSIRELAAKKEMEPRDYVNRFLAERSSHTEGSGLKG
jgi:hypothetical protein